LAVLIDTSVLITWERRNLTAADLIALVPDEPSGIASITASEFLVGVYRADTTERREKRAAIVESVLSALQVVVFDLAVARVHARLTAALDSAGVKMGDHDRIIAATALIHRFDLLTDNVREFGRVPGLVVRRPDWSLLDRS
jgi:predicted nucleic acid-binding protein